MKRLCLVLFLGTTILMTACGNQADKDGVHTTENAETPVIVLGDENITHEDLSGETEAEVEGTTSISTEAATENATDGDSSKEVSFTGTYLGIGNAPMDATVKKSVTNEDGTYVEILSCEDDTITIYMEKEILPAERDTLEKVQSYLAGKYEWKSTIASEDEELSKTIDCPVYRFQVSTGEGEETMVHDVAYITTDGFGFLLDCSCEASTFQENLELMEMWIGSAYIGQ